MRWKSKHFVRWQACLALGCLAVSKAGALTVAELSRQIAQGARLTVVDIRATALFTQGHIPGAINIPAELCAAQNLPPIGSVVVCGAGLGQDAGESAAAALARIPGVTVEVLEGGYAAWESAQGLTTRSRGVTPERLNYISYAQLKAAKPDAVVLVDLRHPPVAKAGAVAAAAMTPSLTDLAAAFPGFHLAQSPSGAKAQNLADGSSSGPPPLLVLIDNGDGVAQEAARKLEAGGQKRYAILAGGELILAREGQAGLQRLGAGTHSTTSLPASGATK
jgi:rhodanese-related sulfurtransferase